MEMIKEEKSKYSSAGLLCQVVTIMAILMFGMMYAISNIFDILTILEWLVILLLLVMAFNNHITFKRKYFTIVYIVIAILSFCSMMIG